MDTMSQYGANIKENIRIIADDPSDSIKKLGVVNGMIYTILKIIRIFVVKFAIIRLTLIIWTCFERYVFDSVGC